MKGDNLIVNSKTPEGDMTQGSVPMNNSAIDEAQYKKGEGDNNTVHREPTRNGGYIAQHTFTVPRAPKLRLCSDMTQDKNDVDKVTTVNGGYIAQHKPITPRAPNGSTHDTHPKSNCDNTDDVKKKEGIDIEHPQGQGREMSQKQNNDDRMFRYPEEVPEDEPEPDIINEMYDQYQEEMNESMVYQQIVGNQIKDGMLILEVTYIGSTGEETYTIPFSVLKKDVPVELAKYIRDQVLEERRGGRYN